MKAKQKVLDLVEMQENIIRSMMRGLDMNMITPQDMMTKLNQAGNIATQIKQFVTLEQA